MNIGLTLVILGTGSYLASVVIIAKATSIPAEAFFRNRVYMVVSALVAGIGAGLWLR